MPKGILNINKEKGISSAKVVSIVRRALDFKKVGHTGTLDLEASGLLPIVIGKATKISSYMMDKDKEYETEVVFGKKTDTLDFSGKVIARSEKIITKEEFYKVMIGFIGEIEQMPPMYSALKVNGKKLYDFAREGIEVQRKRRKVNIYDISLIDFDFPRARIKITCSKGTYIRSLVDDIGESLGTFAYVNELIRTRVGNLKIQESIKSEDILKLDKEEILKRLIPIDFLLENFNEKRFEKEKISSLINGQTLEISTYIDDTLRVYAGDEFIGIGKSWQEGVKVFLKMEKVFYERNDKNI